jgi:septum formation protein
MNNWKHAGRPVILASKSPRRKTILAQMGFTFKVVAPPTICEEEYIDPNHLPASLRKLAKAKALAVAEAYPEALVLGADTVVVQRKQVLGKPANREMARAMLESLSGTKHNVHTGVALVCKTCAFSATVSVCTDVFFRKIGIDEIEAYLLFDEYRDKAGSYAIQGRAMTFVERINGCYYNVVGLPVAKTIGLFRKYVRTRGVTDDAE